MHVDVTSRPAHGTDEPRDAYATSLAELADQGAAVGRGGDYLVAVSHEPPQGYYEPHRSGLAWRQAAPYHTVRFGVAVADALDGRFVPGLAVYLSARRGGRTLAAGECGFRWHPHLHRYAVDMRLTDGRYDLIVRIGVADFPRDDREAGLRYHEPVVLYFPGVVLTDTRRAR